MAHLTGLETRMLSFITMFLSTEHKSPTLKEIGEACGVASSGTVHRYVKSLEDKGVLVREGGWRALRMADDPHDYVDELQQELDELKCGHKIVVPSSRKHAEAMLLVAESYLKGLDEAQRNARPAADAITN